MIVEACRRLSAIAPLSEYQYVGFGGLEYIDFEEFHRGLGIRRMTSIARDTFGQKRFEFNKPYQGIRLLLGEAHDMLPLVDWNCPAITWLDYTEPLDVEMLDDVAFVITKSIPGSVLVVTVNAGADGPLPRRLPALRERLGDLLDIGLTDADTEGWGGAAIQRNLIVARASRVSREVHRAEAKQLFNFEYSDSAKMLTWGCILSSPTHERQIESCRFHDLGFVRDGMDAFRYRFPDLTESEIRYFESHVATTADPPPRMAGIDPAEVQDLAGIYRWR